MPITMQYGPSAQTLGGAANLAGLGDFRRWLAEMGLKQQSLGLQRQEMINRQGNFQQGLEHQYYQDAQHSALAQQQQAMDWIRSQQAMQANQYNRQQELGLHYGQLGETARQHDMAALNQERQRMFQDQEQQQLFQQQQAMEDLKAKHHEEYYAFQLNEQQKRDKAELDRALDFIAQDQAKPEGERTLDPQQAKEMMLKFTAQKNGIKGVIKIPPPPMEKIVQENVMQMPDGRLVVKQPDGKIDIKDPVDKMMGQLDAKALEHFIAGAEKAEQQRSLNDGQPYDQARVEAAVQFRLRLYRENQLAAGQGPQNQRDVQGQVDQVAQEPLQQELAKLPPQVRGHAAPILQQWMQLRSQPPSPETMQRMQLLQQQLKQLLSWMT